jgi:hypothetical protein
MPFHHQWTDTREARCVMASQITYTFPYEILGMFEVPFTITVTWFPQITLHDEQIDIYWV